MVYKDEKGNLAYSTSPLTPQWPSSASSRTSGFSSWKDYEDRDQASEKGVTGKFKANSPDKKYKRIICILRLISRAISLLLTAFMTGTLSYAFAKYYLTRNNLISGDAHPWVTPATIWPTYMLLGISTITFFMNLITLSLYMCGVAAANKTNTWGTVISVVLVGVHVAAWATAAGLFKMANNGKDLWGYSCSSQADAIQEQVHSFLNFGKLCTMQSGAWQASIAEAVAYFLSFIIMVLAMRRSAHKKKMAKVRESLSMEAGYGDSQSQNFEVGSVYKPSRGLQYIPLGEEPGFV